MQSTSFNNHIISDNIINVNTYLDNILNYYENNLSQQSDFYDFVQSQSEIKIESEKKSLLFKRVPNIHQEYVKSIIKNQFNGIEEDYVKTIPLFFTLFSVNDCRICNDSIVADDRKERRKLKRKKKHLIFWSAQLLKLMGLKRSSIITNDCVKFYKEEMQQTDDFLAQHRLIGADGKIIKLVTNESKQKQKVAQILKMSDCLSLMARDKGFTFMLITLTLPPAFHCNPLSGKDSYQGYTPEQTLHTLNRYWRKIRGHMSNHDIVMGENAFGIQVLELQRGATLHLHCLIYSSLEDQETIMKIIERVRYLENRKYNDKKDATAEQKKYNLAHRIGVDNWDISVRDNEKVDFVNGKDTGNAGAKYLFKYIMKTHTNYNDENKDDAALKNMAARFFYQCRGFNFFGVKGSITKFNFLQKNYVNYKNDLHKDVVRVLRQADYYDFIRHYEQYFSNIYSDGEDKIFLGVAFDKSRFEEENNLISKSILNNEIVMIEKRQYCVFEKRYEEEIYDVKNADKENELYDNLIKSYDKVVIKKENYDIKLNEYLNNLKLCIFKDEKLLTKNEAMKLYDFSSFKEVDLIYDFNYSSNDSILHLFNAIQEKPVLTDKPISKIEIINDVLEEYDKFDELI